MSAGVITVRVDNKAVLSVLASLSGRMQNLKPAMRGIGAELREVSMRSFDGQHAPDGHAWRPLSAAAIVARARRNAPKGFAKNRAKTLARFASGAKALLNTGELRNSIQVKSATATSVTVGTRLPYAAIHQFGGMAGRGRKVRIPARPFIGLDERGSAQIVDALRAYIMGAQG